MEDSKSLDDIPLSKKSAYSVVKTKPKRNNNRSTKNKRKVVEAWEGSYWLKSHHDSFLSLSESNILFGNESQKTECYVSCTETEITLMGLEGGYIAIKDDSLVLSSAIFVFNFTLYDSVPYIKLSLRNPSGGGHLSIKKSGNITTGVYKSVGVNEKIEFIPVENMVNQAKKFKSTVSSPPLVISNNLNQSQPTIVYPLLDFTSSIPDIPKSFPIPESIPDIPKSFPIPDIPKSFPIPESIPDIPKSFPIPESIHSSKPNNLNQSTVINVQNVLKHTWEVFTKRDNAIFEEIPEGGIVSRLRAGNHQSLTFEPVKHINWKELLEMDQHDLDLSVEIEKPVLDEFSSLEVVNVSTSFDFIESIVNEAIKDVFDRQSSQLLDLWEWDKNFIDDLNSSTGDSVFSLRTITPGPNQMNIYFTDACFGVDDAKLKWLRDFFNYAGSTWSIDFKL